MTRNEVWIPIKDYEGKYEVSNKGRVKSIGRAVNCNNHYKFTKDIILKPEILEKGYERVALCKHGKVKKKQVHRLVLENFNPIKDDTLQVNHIDGNKRNNCVENLEWVTAKENNQHARETGLLTHFGKGNHKLNADEVRKIRKLYNTGNYSQREIGELFDVCRDTINSLLLGKTYSHVL